MLLFDWGSIYKMYGSGQPGLPQNGLSQVHCHPYLRVIIAGCWRINPSCNGFRCMLLGHYLRGLEYRVELMQLLTLSKVSNSDARDGEHAAWDLQRFFSPEPNLENKSCGFKQEVGLLWAVVSIDEPLLRYVLLSVRNTEAQFHSVVRICCM